MPRQQAHTSAPSWGPVEAPHKSLPRHVARPPGADAASQRETPEPLARSQGGRHSQRMDTSMSYIAHSLGQSETLLYKARFPIFYHLAAWFLFGACVIAGVAAYAGGYSVPGGLLALAGIVLLLGILLPIWTTEI